MSECVVSGYDTCICHDYLPEARAALATAQQQVRDLRAALDGVIDQYAQLAVQHGYRRRDMEGWSSIRRARAALAATAEPEAGR